METKVVAPGKVERHSNTTSSMYITSTISVPNIKTICMAVAKILFSQVSQDIAAKKVISPQSTAYAFSEQKYFVENPDEFNEERIEMLREPPSVENIYQFIKSLYDCAKFSPECFIMSLVYINRFVSNSGSPYNASNWRPVTIIALLVAQKVWDDRNLTTADFAFIYGFFTNDQLNSLEMAFLESINFNTYVKGQIYHKYYYELRDIVKSEEEFALKPLDAATIASLEGYSQHLQELNRAKAQRLNKTEHARA